MKGTPMIFLDVTEQKLINMIIYAIIFYNNFEATDCCTNYLFDRKFCTKISNPKYV